MLGVCMGYAFVFVQRCFVGGREGVDHAPDFGGIVMAWLGVSGVGRVGRRKSDDVGIASLVDDPSVAIQACESDILR